MIKVINNKIQGELLNDDGTLNERIIKSYDYIKFKNDFERIVDMLIMNQMAHQLYKEELKYEINDNLEFVIFFDDSNYNKTHTKVMSYSRQFYDNSTAACKALLVKIKSAWNYLNEVERFIIKSLEFDIPPLTDEELIEELYTYKNKYFIYKKSAYIKLGTVLKLNSNDLNPEECQMKLYDYIKWYNEHREN